MKFPVLRVFYIFLQFDLFQKAITLKCQSPQYVIIGEEGILECSFPAKFQAIVWYDSVNITKALVTKIEKQHTGNLKVSGDGYEDGIYDIFLNGSLIIPSVSTYHDRTFKVMLIDETFMIQVTELVVTTIVHSSQTSPAINLCGSDDLCSVDLMKAGFLKCTFERARPAVHLTWYSQSDERNEIRNATSTIRKDGEYTFMSIATTDISHGDVTPLRVFTCEASGPALWFSKISTSALVFNFQENLKYRNDSIIQITAVLNTRLHIPCAKEGMPIAFVWSFQRFDQSSHLVLSVNDNRKVINNLENTLGVFRNGSLNFPQVTTNLEGIFTCTYFTTHVSSVNSVRVTVVEYDHEESAQGLSTAAVVIIIVVVVVAIFGILIWTCFIRRRKLKARNKDKNNFSDDPSSQPMIESTNTEREKKDERTVEEKKDHKMEEGMDGDGEKEEEKMYRDRWGAAVSGVKFDHDDELVNSIDDIECGDHIVLSSWILHPRCHAIVVDKDKKRNKLLVIRFTYSKGVTEEWLSWKPPTYRVTRYYLGDKQLESNCSIDEVLSRARSLKGNDKLKYSITKNTCKTFARWCKTGALPAGRFGYGKSSA